VFTIEPSSFSPILSCTDSIDSDHITSNSIIYYDKDGFELTTLEVEYYRKNKIYLSNCLNNTACQKPWMLLTNNDSRLSIDHSMLLERYSYAGDALDQLIQHSSRILGLHRLIATKFKWGIDFSLDYIANDEVTDVIHIEIDSQHLDKMLEVKHKTETILLNTDWVNGAKTLRQLKHKWIDLEGHAQSDWKARYFGFPYAENVRKSI
jgi:hypothetical protein